MEIFRIFVVVNLPSFLQNWFLSSSFVTSTQRDVFGKTDDVFASGYRSAAGLR